MFNPKTPKIEKIAKDYSAIIKKLEKLFGNNVYMYIDYANIRPFSNKLNWHIGTKRLKQFLDSFDKIKYTKFYQGTLESSEQSRNEIKKLKKLEKGDKFKLITKPVKIMELSIDATSIPIDSPALLNQFIRRALMREYNIKVIEYLNKEFAEMNKMGINHIEDRKCNFDVEIGVDMLLDYERNDDIDTFVLWSGDSDFADPLKKLLENNKKVILFATAGRIARELNALKELGLHIFDIADLKEFICWKREQEKKYT